MRRLDLLGAAQVLTLLEVPLLEEQGWGWPQPAPTPASGPKGLIETVASEATASLALAMAA